MSKAETLITAHLDTWTSAIKAKSSAGRGSGRKREFYGVSKLRELILELGVRGLLVPQDPNEEPATELLKKAASQRKRLQVSGELRKSKESTAIEDEELPFNIPESWVWARFPEVCFYSPGKTPSTKNPTYWESEESDAGYPWASISDMEHYGSVEFTSKRVSHLAAEKVFKSPPSMAGTILMSFKLTVGKISKLEVASYHNEAILSITPYEGIFKDYIHSHPIGIF
jgi:type I restriction enzyme S subunit